MFGAVSYLAKLNYTALHNTELQFLSSFQTWTTLNQTLNPIQFNQVHTNALHHNTLQYTPLQYTLLNTILLWYIITCHMLCALKYTTLLYCIIRLRCTIFGITCQKSNFHEFYQSHWPHLNKLTTSLDRHFPQSHIICYTHNHVRMLCPM